MTEVKQEEIAARAYRIWEQEGRPPGKEVEHWLRAEWEIGGEIAGAPPAPVATQADEPSPHGETGIRPAAAKRQAVRA